MSIFDRGEAHALLSWQVGRVKITRIVEMDLPVAATAVIPDATPEELRKSPWLYPHFVGEDDNFKLSVQRSCSRRRG